MEQKTKRLLSLLLTVIMLVTTQGFTALADTVSRDDVQNVTAEEEVNGAQTVVPEGADAPANPVHHCVKDDTDWSYIYFGSYPQSEVTNQETIAAIDRAIAAGSAVVGADTAAAEGDAETAGMDVELDGIKYRRISKHDCNNTDYFDNEENNGYRYFKWEPIKWRVLDNNDNETLFVMADSALDCKCYNDEDEDITWENSTIRSWLNDSFYQSAFSSAEQSAIKEWPVVNEDNSYSGAEGGKDTTDHVYLLSIGEVTNEKYGFCSDYSTYSASRQLQISDYANARGAWRDTYSEYKENCWWWLRSPGDNSGDAADVDDNGYVSRDGSYVDYSDDGAVPALHINLSSNLWSVADDGTGSEVGSMPKKPVHHCVNDDIDYTDFSYVYFGSYPQGEVRDSATIAEIDRAIATSGTTAEAGDTGVDVWVSGTKYRRISKDDTNHDGRFDEVKNNGYRYFKWERIKWRVLDNNDNDTLFVAADKALDCKDYNDEYVSITWENSTIRNWLNGSFYQTAFSSTEQSAIKEWPVVNEDNSYSGAEGGKDTTDHVYLLSIGEVTNEKYGFCSDYSTYSASRQLQISDYANARGALRYTDSEYEGSCWWWLRSPGLF